MKELVKKFIPSFILAGYHLSLAYLASLLYNRPSERLIVIGVTGTNGKSSVASIITQMLNLLGHKTGMITTVEFNDGKHVILNNKKMTMPGRFFLQSKLAAMVDNNCEFAVVETTSEGILQYRHSAIHYDTAVFTNLAPEHLERHGSFANYKKAKLRLFEHLQNSSPKILVGKKVPKVIVANGNDEAAYDFLDFVVDRKIIFGTDEVALTQKGVERLIATDLRISSNKTSFVVEDHNIETQLLGKFNVENILAASAALIGNGLTLDRIISAILKVHGVAGRMEKINEGQNFSVVVDYAPEPNSLRAAYEFLDQLPHERLIHVLGSAGGGRDKSRRRVLGEMAGKKADIVIVTNEDPYDEDPMDIIKGVAEGAQVAGKQMGDDLWMIEDRRQAIGKAFSFAQPGDLVLLTGKGAEQAIVGRSGHFTPWDERAVARELLKSPVKQ